jgi:hypothetical protein
MTRKQQQKNGVFCAVVPLAEQANNVKVPKEGSGDGGFHIRLRNVTIVG